MFIEGLSLKEKLIFVVSYLLILTAVAVGGFNMGVNHADQIWMSEMGVPVVETVEESSPVLFSDI